MVLKEKPTLYLAIVLTIILGVALLLSSTAVDKALEFCVQVTSIVAGIVIAFLSAKVIQLRQEKLQLKPEIISLTKKLNCFRKIVHLVFSDPRFWPNGMRRHIEHTYPHLTYYSVRNIIFINENVTAEARTFLEDEAFGEMKKSVYLEMKSFVPEDLYKMVHDPLESEEIYPIEQLRLWSKYSCGGMMWSFFVREYHNYEGQIHFEQIPDATQKAVVNLSNKVDKSFRNVEFGPELIGELGGKISETILPKLTNLQKKLVAPLPPVIKFMYRILIVLILTGAVLPILISAFALHDSITKIVLSVNVGIMVYFFLRLIPVMQSESDVIN